MTEAERKQCDQRLQMLHDAGVKASLREFSSVAGVRVFATDDLSKFYQRDSEDPVGLLDDILKLFELEPPEREEPSSDALDRLIEEVLPGDEG